MGTSWTFAWLLKEEPAIDTSWAQWAQLPLSLWSNPDQQLSSSQAEFYASLLREYRIATACVVCLLVALFLGELGKTLSRACWRALVGASKIFLFRPARQSTPYMPSWRGGRQASLGSMFSSRAFVRDIARLAEHIVMNDIGTSYWSFDANAPHAADELKWVLRSRECAPFFAPDRLGDVSERPAADAGSCHVRQQRAAWSVAFKQAYAPEVADWIDTAVGTEKPVAVLLLRPIDRPPIVAVAFRGSKTLQDYVVTDASPSFIPVPMGMHAGGASAADATGTSVNHDHARLMPFLAGDSAPPCVTVGAWQAYAGEPDRRASGSSPRIRVRRAVERLLNAHSDAQLVVSGHSLGGALATLCVFDLFGHSTVVREAAPVTLINFAAPRMFNQAFQDAMSKLVR